MNFAGDVLQNVDGIKYFYIAGILIFMAPLVTLTLFTEGSVPYESGRLETATCRSASI